MSIIDLEKTFQERIDKDEKIEPRDWRPEKYRQTLISFHSIRILKSLECFLKIGSRAPSLTEGSIARQGAG
jgi:ring-1,2-phenylacetyl-CoA epoxidase subunit PaaA